MGTARFIKQIEGYRGVRRLYHVDPPMPVDDAEPTEYVVVSGVHAEFRGFSVSETYIFPADAEGKVTDWAELPGSFRGDIDHAAALSGAGYVIVEAE